MIASDITIILPDPLEFKDSIHEPQEPGSPRLAALLLAPRITPPAARSAAADYY